MIFTVSFEKLFAASIIAAAAAVGAQTTSDSSIFSNDLDTQGQADPQAQGQRGTLYSERALRGNSRGLKTAKGSKNDKKDKKDKKTKAPSTSCLPEDPTSFRTKFRKSLGCPEYSAPFTVEPYQLLDKTGSFQSIVQDCLVLKEDCPHGWPLGCWNTSEVTDMSEAFNGFYIGFNAFNEPIEGWDVSRVTSMFKMFWWSHSFNQPLQRWDTGKVENFEKMFNSAREFNQPIDCFDTSSGIRMVAMFQNALKFDQPIGNWDVSNVEYLNGIFNGAVSFNQPLDSWNPMSTTSTNTMFYGAEKFNQCLSSWATEAGNVDYDNTYLMFDGSNCGDTSIPDRSNDGNGKVEWHPNQAWCGCSVE